MTKGLVTTLNGRSNPSGGGTISQPATVAPAVDPDWSVRPVDPPPEPPDGSSLLLGLLVWFGAATSVELWWLGTSTQSLMTLGDLMTTVARFTGMLGGYGLLVQILLLSRIGWLERRVGTRALVAWHRRLGALLVVAVLAHLVASVAGYGAVRGVSFLTQAWTMLVDWPEMASAFLSTGALVGVGVISIRAIRRALPYELWIWCHRSSYAVLALAYSHQFSYGQEFIHGGFGWWYWVGLHVLVAGFVVWGRLLSPLVLNLRHRLRVICVVAESPDTVSIYVAGRRLDRLDASSGHFFRWRFLAPRVWWQSHPFSLSAAPNGHWLRLTVRAVGQHTADLRYLKAGVPVLVHGPAGVFTARRRRCPRALLIAWGSGIAPIRALIEELPPGAVVVYRARSRSDLVLHAELAELTRIRGADVRYVLGHRHDPGPRRLATPAGIQELVPDVRRRDVYLCGPSEAVRPVRAALRRLRVPRRQIHLDAFEF